MSPWTTLPGYPVVRVSAGRNGALTLTQSRFTYASSDDETLWQIPLFSNDSIFSTKQTTIPHSNWNIDKKRRGFYRVVYDTEVLDIHRALKLSPMARVGRLADVMESAKSGDATLYESLTLMSRFISTGHQPCGS